MTEMDIARVLGEEATLAERERDHERDYVRVPPPGEPAQVYSLRLPVDRLEQLRRVAARDDEAPSVMIRRWVLERLDRELERNAAKPEDLFDPESVHEVEELLNVVAPRVSQERRHALLEIWLSAHRGVDREIWRFMEAALTALIEEPSRRATP
ncbi:MAG: hypothetical protein ACRDYA_10095 [Egibacteraceae bacterium]